MFRELLIDAFSNATELVRIDAKGAFRRAFITAFEVFLGAFLIAGVSVFVGKGTTARGVEAIGGMLSSSALNWQILLAMVFVPIATVIPQRFVVHHVPKTVSALTLTMAFDIASSAQGVILGIFIPALTELSLIKLLWLEIFIVGTLYLYQSAVFMLAQLVNGRAKSMLHLKPKHIALIVVVLLAAAMIVAQTDKTFVGNS